MNVFIGPRPVATPFGTIPIRSCLVRTCLLLGDTHAVGWFEQAKEAEEFRDWDTAIALVSAHAECYSANFYAHDHHLWHMDLLARAQRIEELTDLARVDVHARRRLNRLLREASVKDGRGEGTAAG